MSIPPDNGGFLLRRKMPKSVVANYEQAGFEIGNAFSKIPSQYFLSEALVQPLTIDMDFNLEVQLYGFALIYHNIPQENSTIKLQYSSEGFEDFEAEAEDDVTITPRNTYIFIDRSYRYVRLEITSWGNIRIGELFPAQGKFQFPCNYSWGYEENFEVSKEVITTDGGQHFEQPDEDIDDNLPAEFERIRMNFGPVDKQHHADYKKLVRPGMKIFIPECNQPLCYHGIVPDKALQARKHSTGDEYSLRFWENALPPEE